MNDTLYICFNESGITKMLKREPTGLDRGEFYAILKFSVPREFFAKRPIPRAEVMVPAPYINERSVSIDPQVVQGAVDDKSAQLSMALNLFGQMLDKARQSEDPALKELANQSFTQLVEWGIEVKLVDAAEVPK